MDFCLLEEQGFVVAPEKNYEVPCTIFAPCAMGGILNSKTISRLQCEIVAGSANNQLSVDSDGRPLEDKDILYAPDYVINAGGLINVSLEIVKKSVKQ